MDEESRINEVLEQLAPQLSPRSMVKWEDEPVWNIELAHGDHVVLSLLSDPLILVCSATVPLPAQEKEARAPIHERLLVATEEEGRRGGCSYGLDEQSVVIYFNTPWETFGRESLLKSIETVRTAARKWRQSLDVESEVEPGTESGTQSGTQPDEKAEPAPTDPELDMSNALRV